MFDSQLLVLGLGFEKGSLVFYSSFDRQKSSVQILTELRWWISEKSIAVLPPTFFFVILHEI